MKGGIFKIMLGVRTDLAMEARESWEHENLGELKGVRAEQSDSEGFSITRVKVETQEAAEKLCKPMGTYVTLELSRLLRREDDAFADGAQALAQVIRELMELTGTVGGSVLVAGLGNPAITPDSVGHVAARNTLVTRHLLASMPDSFPQFSSVALVEPGVLGTTGVESVDVIRAVSREISPDLIIAVDALASGSMDRVCRTVQATDVGIVPGSGVGNARKPLDRALMGVPVIALGVPTVVDAATLALDIARSAGVELEQGLLDRQRGMIVTPKDIDSNVADIARLIGYGINLALHQGLTVEDVDLFLS